MPTQTEKSRQSARLFLSSVTQTMTLRGLYGYMTALTRPIRYTEETRGGKSCAADRDATNPVPIRQFPNPPGDEPTQKPGREKRWLC